MDKKPTAELIAWLREPRSSFDYVNDNLKQAADRLAELEGALEQIKDKSTWGENLVDPSNTKYQFGQIKEIAKQALQHKETENG